MTHPTSTAPSTFATIRRRLSCLLLFLLLSYVLWSLWRQADQLEQSLNFALAPWLVLAGIFLALNQVTMACRQVLLLRHTGIVLPLADSVRITFAGLFANNLMPAGIGHDLTRMVYLRRYGEQGAASVGGLVILDRFLGLMGLSVLALCAFTGLSQLYPDAVPKEASMLLLYATLVPLPLGAVILGLRHDSTFDYCSRLAGLLPLGGSIQKLLAGMRQFSARKRVLLLALGQAALGHLCTVIGVACIAYGMFGVRAALGSIIVSPLVFVASSIPVTPSNLGWTEAVAGAMWALFGLSGGVLIFLAWRVVSMLVSLAGCATYLTLRNQSINSTKAS